MKLKNAVLTASSVALLSACADLGFGDFPLADATGEIAGPVMVADLETTAVTEAAPMPEKGPVVTTMPPEITVADLGPVPAPTPSVAAVQQPAAAPAPKQEVAAAAPQPAPIPTTSFGPDDAKPGECYARVTIPAKTEKSSEQVLVSQATVKTETIPATYKTVTEQVLVTAASTRTETVPATYKTIMRKVPVSEDGTTSVTTPAQYKTVTERVLVTPAQTKEVTVPAEYETVTERVKVRDAYTEWKPASKVYAIGAEALGGTILANQVSSAGVMCLVEIPAEFKTVTKRVLVREATTREEQAEAVYETVTRQVLDTPEETTTTSSDQKFKEVPVRVVDQPASVRTIPVPATYKTVTKRVIDTPAMTREVPVPAVYRDDVTETVLEPARQEWAQVLCEVNATPDLVQSLQRALQARDLYAGAIDGIIGPQTRAAIKAYQNGLSEVLTMDSAKNLGLAI